MPTFGSRKARTPEPAQPETAPGQGPAPSALERLNALLAEQSEISATLAEHREKRDALLRADGELGLGAIRAMQTEDEALRLRLEQIALRLPDIERELEQERRKEWERTWQAHVPILAQAETELVEAIKVFHQALEHANAVHARARSRFGEKVRQEFVTPPPPSPVYNDWSLRQYLAVAERRKQQAPAAPMLELSVEAPINIPPAERFAPRRVPYQLVEQISPIAPMRKVRMLHTVRASNLAIGHARLRAGEEMAFPARAAFVLTYSGVGVYTDVETAEVATAVA